MRSVKVTQNSHLFNFNLIISNQPAMNSMVTFSEHFEDVQKVISDGNVNSKALLSHSLVETILHGTVCLNLLFLLLLLLLTNL